jgi:micrococcal nuclease
MSFFNGRGSLVWNVALLLILMAISAVALCSDFTRVEFLKNYDGDTFTVNIRDVPEVFGRKIPVRIRGIDAPEMMAEAACERDDADRARRFLKRALKGKRIRLLGCERDKYFFRLLCTVKADSADVGESILKGHLAVQYNGGPEPAWDCRDLSR